MPTEMSPLNIEPGKIPWMQVTTHLIQYVRIYEPLNPEIRTLMDNLSRALKESPSKNDIKETLVLATTINAEIANPISEALAKSLDTLGWPDNFQAAKALIHYAPAMVFGSEGRVRNPVAVMASGKLMAAMEQVIEKKATQLKTVYGFTYDVNADPIEEVDDPAAIRDRISTINSLDREDLRQICVNLLSPDVGPATQAAGLFETELLRVEDPLERYLVLSRVEQECSRLKIEAGWEPYEIVRTVLNQLEDIVLNEMVPDEDEFGAYLKNHALGPIEK